MQYAIYPGYDSGGLHFFDHASIFFYMASKESHLKAVSVDDEKMNLLLIEQLGQKNNLDVVSFDKPVDALEYLKQEDADLLFVDYMMPGMDGITLIQQVRFFKREIPIVMITAVTSDAELKLRALQAGATDFLNKPFDMAEFSARIQNLSMLRRNQLFYKKWAEMLKEEVSRATRDIEKREYETLSILGEAAEFRDPETGQHVFRVSSYSKILAAALGFDEGRQQTIFHSAPLHDIGKIGIPDSILLKPGPLDKDEFTLMKTHTSIGYNLTRKSSSVFLRTGAEIAISHHEKYDGSGYPKGLEGENIPIYGRIVAIADVFDALTSRRPYKEPWSFEDASNLLKEQRGRHFDPKLIDIFTEQIDQFREIKENYQDSEEGETSEEGASTEGKPTA